MQYDASQAIHRHLRSQLPLTPKIQDKPSKLGRDPAGEVEAAKDLQQLQCMALGMQLKKILGKAPPISEVFLDEDGEYLWIVKPTFLNRGRGIQVFSRLDALLKFVSDNLCGYV